MKNNKKEAGRFFRFAIVGAIGTVVDFGIFNILSGLFSMPVVWASAISFTCAVINNFLLNRIWTYPDSRSKSIFSQIIQFALISIIGMGIRVATINPLSRFLTQVSYSIFPSSFALKPEFIGKNAALAAIIGVVLIWNYFANRFWTYSDVK
jgi:putative flippase GtrA